MKWKSGTNFETDNKLNFYNLNVEDFTHTYEGTTYTKIKEVIDEVGNDSEGNPKKLKLKLDKRNVIFRKWTRVKI